MRTYMARGVPQSAPIRPTRSSNTGTARQMMNARMQVIRTHEL